jgi:hypothetical protein
MQDQSTSSTREDRATLDVAGTDDLIDKSVLTLLLASRFPGLWSVEELKREIGRPIEVHDALVRLNGQGLIHRLDDFVFVTHAAACCEELQY